MNAIRLVRAASLFFLVHSVSLVTASAEDWPQFLGPLRNGISNSTVKLVDEFPPNGPKVVWRVPLGVGMSGIVVAGKQCLLLAHRNHSQSLVSLDRGTGEVLWEAELAPAYENAMGDGPRATPTIDGPNVYCFTGEGILAARSLKNGAELWTRNLVADYDTVPSEYGISSSPLVVGRSVIVQVGADRAAVVAVDAESGKTLWEAGAGRAGYSSPALLSVGDKSQIVAFTGEGCIGISPASGSELWSYPFETDYDCNIATPLAIDGKVLISSGENHGSALLKIEETNGAFSVSEVWTQFGTSSGLRSEWQTPLIVGKHLFGFDNIGSAGPITNLVCMNIETGAVHWKKMRFGKSNGIVADGKLLVSTMAGELVLVKADTEKFIELGRASVIGKNRQAPTLVDGWVFLRDDEEVVCIDLRAN